MRLSLILVAAALSAAILAGCEQQRPAATEPAPEAPAVEAPAAQAPAQKPPAQAAANGAASACPVTAHRRWEASLTTKADGAATLTISGQVDLPKPGYSVSLRRTPGESATTNEPRLLLLLTPPSQPVAGVVTAHPVYYFGPASGQYSVVHIECEGAPLTDIKVATAP